MRTALILVAMIGIGRAASADEPIVIAMVGDIMLGSTYPDEDGSSLPPNDGADLLTDVTPLISRADLAIGNLEGPLIDQGETDKCEHHPKELCFAFRVPTRYGRYLKSAGFDVMSLANNHAMDFDDEGRASTEKTLDDLGIAHSGRVGDIARRTVRGRDVAVIAFATADHSYDLREIEKSASVVRTEAAKGSLVIVSFHGGGEGVRYTHVPEGEETFHRRNRGDVRAFAHAMIDAGAVLVFGHGPHVVRGMETYKDRLIAYSLGNFATYRGMLLSGRTRLAIILEARLDMDGKFLGGTAHAVKQLHYGGPTLDPDRGAVRLIRNLTKEDFPETGVRISRHGTLRPPAPP